MGAPGLSRKNRGLRWPDLGAPPATLRVAIGAWFTTELIARVKRGATIMGGPRLSRKNRGGRLSRSPAIESPSHREVDRALRARC